MPLRSYLYRFRPLYALCVLVLASLAGGMAAHADEVQPTAQALATPTVVVGAQPTEVLPPEPTVENLPTTPTTLIPTIHVPPTETFRAIEISTRAATYVPTFVPTAVPTVGSPQPTIDPDPLATATADWGIPPALTTEPTATPTAMFVDEITPLPFSTDTSTSIVTVTSTSTVSTVTETTTPTIILSPTGTPGWLPPGLECNLLQSEIAVRLDVPYIHQVMDIGVGDGNWACGPTSIAMILAYYGKLAPWQEYIAQEAANYRATTTSIARTTSIATVSVLTSTPTAPKLANTSTPTVKRTGTVRPARTVSAKTTTAKTTTAKTTATTARRSDLGFGQYVTNAYSNNGYIYNSTAQDPRGAQVAGLYGTICPTGFADWSRMRFVLEQHGLSSRHISATWDSVVDALKRGHPVVIGADLTPVGHILVAIGYTENGQLIVNDPYGNRFAPGYGGTRGEGLLYPWNCSRVRNALEVIGEYPPAPRPAQSGRGGDTGPSLRTLSPAEAPASYGGRTYYRADDREPAVPLRASAPLVSTPSTAKSNSVPTAKPPARSALIVTGVAVVSAATGDKPDGSGGNTFGWGLFSMLSVAVAVVGVRGFRKTRRAVVEAAESTPGDPSSAVLLENEKRRHADANDTLQRQDIVAASNVESVKQAAGHAVTKPKRPLRTTPSDGLQIVLRRTLPVVLPLLFLGVKLYQVSKGQEDARTRVTDETKQFMIRNL
ncbi:MAG: C39 family peptidase [Chloroflexia bacterium]